MSRALTDPAPVAAFVYNREGHARRMLEALSKSYGANQTDLYIFSDGPKSPGDARAVSLVRESLRKVEGFRSISIYEEEHNRGLATSIIGGVTRVLHTHERVIVFEDDLISARECLLWFNTALDRYKHEGTVFSVSGYSPPDEVFVVPDDYDYDAYFSYRMMCWGWATWGDRWVKADWNVEDYASLASSAFAKRAYIKKIGSDSLDTLQQWKRGERDVWACRWVYTHFKHGAVCLCPIRSYIANTGLDGSGSNCGTNTTLANTLEGPYPKSPRLPEFIVVDEHIRKTIVEVYNQRRDREIIRGLGRRIGLRTVGKLAAWARNSAFRLLTYKSPESLHYLGTEYGGWYVIKSLIESTDEVISAGAGEDISFDVELVKQCGCRVHILDPTPRAIQHYDNTKSLICSGEPAPINNARDKFYRADKQIFDNLVFHPVGLWKTNTNLRFFAPNNAEHVSHSIDNLHGTSEFFEADCVTLMEFKDQVLRSRLSLLKLDIEGAEYAVLRTLIHSALRPRLLLVEFHPGKSVVEKYLRLKTLMYVLRLRLIGYYLVSRHEWNHVFVHSES